MTTELRCRGLTALLLFFAVSMSWADVPTIVTTPPPRQVVEAGGVVFLIAPVHNADSVQWYRNGVPIEGATESTLIVADVQAIRDSGYYHLVATNSHGSVRSARCFVRVLERGAQVFSWHPMGPLVEQANNAVMIARSGDAYYTNQGTVVGPSPAQVDGIFDLVSANVAIKMDGTVVSWDQNGNVTTVPELTDVVSLGLGDGFTIVLKSDGTVSATGFMNWAGQMDIPVGLDDVVQIATYNHHTLALKADGTVVGWGNNSFGEITLPPHERIVGIATGHWHSVLLKDDGTVTCFGFDFFGQASPPQDLNQVAQVFAGHSHSVALRRDGSVVEWGEKARMINEHGVVRYGDAAADRPPYGLGPVLWVTSADRQTMILRDSSGDTGPGILLHPVSQSPQTGGQAMFSISARGGGAPLSIQWTKNDVPIEGATSPQLVITNVTAADEGSYAAKVLNYLGEVESSPASLTINDAPVFVFQPNSASLIYGESLAVTVRVNTVNASPVAWSLLLGDRIIQPSSSAVAQINNEVEATLTFGPLSAGDAGTFQVRATNAFGYRDSESATLAVASPFLFWRAAWFNSQELADPAISSLAADPDGDGYNNLLEYALGLNPREAEVGLESVLDLESHEWVFTYSRPAGRPDIQITPTVSSDLVNWSAQGVQHELLSDDEGLEIWQARYSRAGNPTVFFRLMVQLDSPPSL